MNVWRAAKPTVNTITLSSQHTKSDQPAQQARIRRGDADGQEQPTDQVNPDETPKPDGQIGTWTRSVPPNI